MLFDSQTCLMSGRRRTYVVVPIRWGATVRAGGCEGCCRSVFGGGLSLCLRVSVLGSVTCIDFDFLSGNGGYCRLVFACRFCRRVVVAGCFLQGRAFGSRACHVVTKAVRRSLLIMICSWWDCYFLLEGAMGDHGSVCPGGFCLLVLAAPSPCCWLCFAVVFVVILWARWRGC